MNITRIEIDDINIDMDTLDNDRSIHGIIGLKNNAMSIDRRFYIDDVAGIMDEDEFDILNDYRTHLVIQVNMDKIIDGVTCRISFDNGVVIDLAERIVELNMLESLDDTDINGINQIMPDIDNGIILYSDLTKYGFWHTNNYVKTVTIVLLIDNNLKATSMLKVIRELQSTRSHIYLTNVFARQTKSYSDFLKGVIARMGNDNNNEC